MSFRASTLLSWSLILAAVAFIVWRNTTVGPLEKQKADLVTARLQGRNLVGAAALSDRLLKGKDRGHERLYEQAEESLNRGTYAQRLRFVVVAGELKGAEEAREQLHHLDERYRQQRGDPPKEETEITHLLDRLYADRTDEAQAAATLSPEEQDELRRRLGWFGDVALAPADTEDEAARTAVLAPAYRTMLSLLGVGVFMLGAGVLGLTLLVVLLVLCYLGRLRDGVTLGSPRHSVYIETFALYMLLFLGLSWLARLTIDGLSLRQGRLALSGLAALGSLAALGWPMLRGISWRQLRQDIGWHSGRKPWLEPLLGAGCYAMALPMLIVGVVLLVVLTKLRDRLGWGPGEFDPSNAPSHPIVFWAGKAGWWVWLEILFVAGIVAPIVEETMFRGVLYRYLRELSVKFHPFWSICLSALMVSFLFAVIHPQGFLGVPPLMALALAFALMREWRGTLLPPMIAHGINNTVATLLLFLMS